MEDPDIYMIYNTYSCTRIYGGTKYICEISSACNADVPFLRFCLTVRSTFSMKDQVSICKVCLGISSMLHPGWQSWKDVSLVILLPRRGFRIRVSNLWRKTTLNVCHPKKKLGTSTAQLLGSSARAAPQTKGGLGWCGGAERGECALWPTPATLLLLGAWKVVAGCGAVCTGWPRELRESCRICWKLNTWSAMENVPVIKRTKRVASQFVIQPTFEFHRYENREP